jgi:hypothetical protein
MQHDKMLTQPHHPRHNGAMTKQQTIRELMIARALFQQKAILANLEQPGFKDYEKTMKRYSGDFSA